MQEVAAQPSALRKAREGFPRADPVEKFGVFEELGQFVHGMETVPVELRAVWRPRPGPGERDGDESALWGACAPRGMVETDAEQGGHARPKSLRLIFCCFHLPVERRPCLRRVFVLQRVSRGRKRGVVLLLLVLSKRKECASPLLGVQLRRVQLRRGGRER